MAEVLLYPSSKEFFYDFSDERYRQYTYLVYGVIYDILLSPNSMLLKRISYQKVQDVLNRVNNYQEEVEDIYAYFKASLVTELKK